MIFESFEKVPYGTCKVATIRPEDPGVFKGSITIGNSAYPSYYAVEIVHDGDTLKPSCVLARVILYCPWFENRDVLNGYARLVAKESLEGDERWKNVKVNLRDGVTAYVRKWNGIAPGDRLMDEFLAEATGFITSCGSLFVALHMGAVLDELPIADGDGDDDGVIF